MNIQVDQTSSNLASAMLNSKIRPRAVVGYGVKIFHPSPPNYVTRSPGVGDFNIHVDDVGNSESANFLALIDSFDLKQMVSFSTHINGHSLDLVVVRNSEPLGPVINIETVDPALSDHLAVKFKIPITKQPFKRKMIKYRNFKSLDSQSLATSISESRICAGIYANLPDMVNGYFDSLTAVIDQVAPTKTRLITIRPKAPWYTIDIDNEKKCRRMYERKWRRTKDPTDRNNYLEKCKHVNQMIHESKSNFYSSVISENKGNQRILFQTIDKLLHRKNDVGCRPSIERAPFDKQPI